MKKIGICTLYYKNRNYGANLQAYALQTVINSLGFHAEIISYYNNTKWHNLLSKIKQSLRRRKPYDNDIRIRNNRIDQFNMSIPHSELFYSNTINRARSNYDCFITGSDQVWNPDWINDYTSLEFVGRSKQTLSYAASTGRIHFDEKQRMKLKKAMENTQYISIREKESIPELESLTSKKIEYVLDPTMLLTRNDWNKICSERLIKEKYLFCYFLGDNENVRKVARDYARCRKLKLVTLPFLNGRYRKVDDGFGDYMLYDVSPKELISLFRYASFVMTDSFHAAVFSHIYAREFIVSGGGKNEMGCRMLSLTELFGTEIRYIKEHQDVSIDKLIALEEETLKLRYDQYEMMKDKSWNFLKGALSDDRRNI